MFVIEVSAVMKKKIIPWSCRKGKCKDCTIKKCIIDNYFILNSDSENEQNYLDLLYGQWINNGIFNIASRYNVEDIIGYKNIDGIECYFINNDKIQERKKYVIKLLLVIEKDELNKALNIVYKSFNKFFNKFTLSFHTNRKVKIYSPKYLIMKDDNSSSNLKPYIEVELKNKIFFDKYFLGKSLVMIMVLVIGIAVLFKFSTNLDVKNITYSIIASVIFTIVVEWLSRLIEIRNQRYGINIGNMSTFLYEQAINNDIRPEILPSSQEVDDLQDPEEEEEVYP